MKRRKTRKGKTRKDRKNSKVIMKISLTTLRPTRISK